MDKAPAALRLGGRRQEGLSVKRAQEMSHPSSCMQGSGREGHVTISYILIMPSGPLTTHAHRREHQVNHSSAVGPWTRFLASQSLSFLICTLGGIRPTLAGFVSWKGQKGYRAVSIVLGLWSVLSDSSFFPVHPKSCL